MTTTTAQDFLFQRIKELLSSEDSMVEAVSELLFVSNDSAYRRIRGETHLVLEEARLLCDHFKISLDNLLVVKPGYTMFQTERVNNKNFSFEGYLSNILKQLKQVDGFNKKEIIYLSKDLPFFHNFLKEPLFAFHYFFWMKSIIRHPDFEDRLFSMNCLSPDLKLIGSEIVIAYNNIPSSEIWNTECINSLIFQIEYYREAGYFVVETDIDLIYKAIAELLIHIKNQAEIGAKYLPDASELSGSKFNFYYNRVTLGDNTIMVIADSGQIVFLNYDVMNYLVTRDSAFCEHTYNDLQAIIKRSTLISNSGEKQRNIFFNRLISKIEDRISKV